MRSKATAHEPMVTYVGILSMQVCVPADWTDDQVTHFARREPCGTTGGWSMRKDGDETLAGAKERVACAGSDARPGHVHIMFDC